MRSSQFAPDPLLAGSAGFAHRGLHRPGVPENSMAAFRAALAAGAGIECDLRLSRDGFAMVFHDGDLNRLCGVSVELESLHAAALMQFQLRGTDERIPWLGDMLKLVGGQVPLLLELKGRSKSLPIDALCAATAATLHRYRGPVGVMSFDSRVGEWLAEHAPEVRRGLVLDGSDDRWTRQASIDRSQAQFLAVSSKAIAAPWLAELRRSGCDVACWTIRTPAERKTATIHADALIWEADGRP